MRRIDRAVVAAAHRIRGAAPYAGAQRQPTSHPRLAREPIILLDDDAPPSRAAVDTFRIVTPDAARARPALRRVADVVLWVGLGLAIVFAYEVRGDDARGAAGDGAPDRAVTPEPSPEAAAALCPALVAPATARPGEVLTLLGYRHRGLNGDLTVFLDGAPIPHEVRGLIRSPYPGRDGVILSLTVPAAIAPGAYDLELTGPLPGERARGGVMDGNVEQHEGRIAARSITIVPSSPIE